MNKRLIVLIDFSKHSASLLKYAAAWSQHAATDLLLVHHTQPLIPSLTHEKDRAQIIRQANEEARHALHELKKALLPPGLPAAVEVTEASLIKTVQHLLDEPAPQVLVMGLKGTGLLKQLFIGSTAVEIIEQVQHTVVAIPKDLDTFAPERIFVAVSEKQYLNAAALHQLLDFYPGIGHITFFHLSKEEELSVQMQRQLQGLAGLFAHRTYTDVDVYRGSHAFDRIRGVVSNSTGELLVVQKGSRLLTDQLFRRFLINELIYDARTPLIILP